MRFKRQYHLYFAAVVFVIGSFGCLFTSAQIRQLPTQGGQLFGGGQQNRNPNDTSRQESGPGFKHRDDLADSITITFRYLDSLSYQNFDSTLNDYTLYYPQKSGYVSLGGNGNPAFPILFTPELSLGWDPGFHALDLYKYTLQNRVFYHTTRPFTSMAYFQGTGQEQVIKVLHTQNIKPNWNAAAGLRLNSNPGIFQNQNAKDNNYFITSFYQGVKKRYAAELMVVGNKLLTAENGGIQDKSFLSDPNRKRRIAVPVRLGDNSGFTQRIFSSNLNVGNEYKESEIFLRQRYDIGKRDSIAINDSTTEYLFYPKLRFQHTIHYKKSSYRFVDNLTSVASNRIDSVYFKDNYDITLQPTSNSFFYLDEWKYISNDFTLKQFPDTKNQRQFLEAGIRMENYSGDFTKPYLGDNLLIVRPGPPEHHTYFNTILHGEYRNKTKNKKWDLSLNGAFYLAGAYIGDFSARGNIQRFLNDKWGVVGASFGNITRSPSFIFQSNTSFNLDETSLTKKENITILDFYARNKRFDLRVRNISVANYAYLTNYYQKDQYSGLINLTQGIFSTKTKVSRVFNLYSDFIVQQTAGNNPIKVPLVYTRQRFAFEGNFFKNFNVSTGLEVTYNTPYKANHYSPILGRFFAQDTTTISNLPTVNLFLDFRIKYFSAFISLRNLNTLDPRNGFSFTNNSFAAPDYPTPGMLFMMGIKWDMVN